MKRNVCITASVKRKIAMTTRSVADNIDDVVAAIDNGIVAIDVEIMLPSILPRLLYFLHTSACLIINVAEQNRPAFNPGKFRREDGTMDDDEDVPGEEIN